MIDGMHPKSGPRPTDSHAERRIYEALAREGALPEGVVGWHSLAFTVNNREHEIDFLLAHPERGFIAIEAKGGQIKLEDGFWLQNGQRMKAPPTKQAIDAAHALARYLREAHHLEPPRFTYAVWFPDMSKPPLPSGDAKGRVLGAEALAWTRPEIASLFDRLLPDKHPSKRPFIPALHEAWGHRSQESPVRLGTSVGLGRFDRMRLDAFLRRLWDAVSENPRLVVRGGAGSGKTQLALLAARERADRGERVLFTCFTEGLARELAEACRALPTIEVGTVRELAVRFSREAGHAEASSPPADWESVAIDGGVAVLDLGRLWDAVVVDEAQDMDEAEWAFLESCAGAGPLLVFADARQAFWPSREIPEERLGLMKVRLRESHRVPAPLLELADAFADGRDVREHVPHALFDSLEVVAAPRDHLGHALEKTLARVLGEHVEPRDIAILSLRGRSVPGGAASLERVGPTRVVRVSDPDARDHVVADTFLRFKGLERPVVLVVDADLVEDRLGVRMHIALTRALTRAIVIASPERLRAMGLLET